MVNWNKNWLFWLQPSKVKVLQKKKRPSALHNRSYDKKDKKKKKYSWSPNKLQDKNRTASLYGHRFDSRNTVEAKYLHTPRLKIHWFFTTHISCYFTFFWQVNQCVYFVHNRDNEKKKTINQSEPDLFQL